jgi:hypothetical protein
MRRGVSAPLSVAGKMASTAPEWHLSQYSQRHDTLVFGLDVAQRRASLLPSRVQHLREGPTCRAVSTQYFVTRTGVT